MTSAGHRLTVYQYSISSSQAKPIPARQILVKKRKLTSSTLHYQSLPNIIQPTRCQNASYTELRNEVPKFHF